MAFFNQFVSFDPLIGELPASAGNLGSSIVDRARRLLQGRTSSEVTSIAEEAEYLISQLFQKNQDEVKAAVDSLKSLDMPSEDLSIVNTSMDRAYERLDLLRERSDVSDFRALEEALLKYADVRDPGVSGVNERDYFAALALWKMADYTTELGKHKGLNAVGDREAFFSLRDFERTATPLLEAMEAVSHAHRLQELTMAKEKIASLLTPVYLLGAERLKKMSEEIRAEQNADLSDRNRINGSKAHEGRRRKHMEAVRKMWEVDKSPYLSAAQAGKIYDERLWKLFPKDKHFVRSTVVSWVIEFEQQRGRRYR
jgi:hypothetical protein